MSPKYEDDETPITEAELEANRQELWQNKKFRLALRLVMLGGMTMVIGIIFVLFTIIKRLGGL